jgi:hypothetical protein
VVAAAFATLWAALWSYLPVALALGLARAFEGAGGPLGSARLGLAGWLLGNGVPFDAEIGPVGLAPLLVTLLAGWRLSRAGVHVTRAIGARHSGSPRVALVVATAIGLGYAALGALAATAATAPGLNVDVPRAALTLGGLGFVAGLTGALRCTGAGAVLARRTPAAVRHGARAGLVAALLLLAAGAGFAGLSVALGGGQAAELIAAYRTGVIGQAGITVVSVAYAGNAAVWAAAYLLGPGFLVGAGTSVRLTEVAVGPLPTLPLFAGVPDGPVGGAGAALLAVPALAGMSAGWMATRRLIRATARAGAAASGARPAGAQALPSWPLTLGAAVLAGPAAGAVLGLLAWASGGPLGAGRLAQIGPPPGPVALITAGVVTVSAVIGAAAGRSFRAHPPS